MRFFFTVLVIAIATATIASSLSPEQQIAAVNSVIHGVADRLKDAGEGFRATQAGESGAEQFAAEASPMEPAQDPEGLSTNSRAGSTDFVDRAQTVEIESAPDFQERPAQIAEPEQFAAEPLLDRAAARPKPLERNQVSEVIQRLGRVSRTAARSATRHK